LIGLLIAAFVAKIIGSSDTEHAKPRPEQKQKSAFRDPIVGFTGGLFVVTAFSVVVLFLQWQTLEKTDRTLKINQRPWINITDIDVKDICLDTNGARVPIELTLTNTGHMPALNLTLWNTPSVRLNGAPDQKPLYSRPTVGISDLGPDVVFPGETPHRNAAAYVPNSQIDWLKMKTAGTIFPVMSEVCVDYTFAYDAERHQTCHTIMPVNKDSRAVPAIPTAQNCASNLGFLRVPGGSFAN
jgi:hypothetical protein